MKRWVFWGSEHSFLHMCSIFWGLTVSCQRHSFSLAHGPTSTASIPGTKSCLGSPLPRQGSANPDVDWFVTPWTFSITHPQKGKQSSKNHVSICFKGHVQLWGVYPNGVFCSNHLRWKLSPFDHLTHFKIGDPREPTLPKKYAEKCRDIAGRKQLLGCTNAAKYKPSMLDAWKAWWIATLKHHVTITTDSSWIIWNHEVSQYGTPRYPPTCELKVEDTCGTTEPK